MNLKLSLFITLVIGTLLVLGNPLPQQGQGSDQGTVAAPTEEQKLKCRNRCAAIKKLWATINEENCQKKCLGAVKG